MSIITHQITDPTPTTLYCNNNVLRAGRPDMTSAPGGQDRIVRKVSFYNVFFRQKDTFVKK